MDPKKDSDSSEESVEDKSEEEDEEEKASGKEHSEHDSDEEVHQMKLRSGKNQRTYTFRNERRKQRATRGRKIQVRKRRSGSTRGKKKLKPSGELREWSGQKSDSESEESVVAVPEMETPVVQRFLYKPGVPWPDLSPYMQQLIEIRIEAEYLTLKNKYVVKNVLWGNDVYTSDSDVVAALQHANLIDMSDPFPTQYEGVSAYVRVTKGRSNYASSLRNGIKSRKCVNYEGHSLRPEKIVYLSSLGRPEELAEFVSRMPSDYPKERPKPAFSIKGARLIPKTNVVFNLSFEVALPFNLDNFADKGTDESTFLSQKLKKNTLYLETASKRYELSQENEEDEEQIFENQLRYRWAEVTGPILFKDYEFLYENGSPLEEKWLNVLGKSIEWNEIEWTSAGVHVKDQFYGPFRCFFYIPL